MALPDPPDAPFVDAAFVVATPGVVLLDARVGPTADADYAAAHLPGARRVSLDADLAAVSDPRLGGRHPLPPPAAFGATLGRLGLDRDDRVVVYDLASGGNAASRAVWMLRAVGVRASVLTGTPADWAAAGLAMTDAKVAYPAKPPLDVARYALPTVELETLVADAEAGRTTLLDARAPARFRGEVEPIDPVPGRIPFARSLFHMALVDAHGVPLDPAAVRAAVSAATGDADPHTLAVSCGSGVTACHLALAMVHAGLPMPALYVGSYSEWCRSGRPLGQGAA